MTDEEAQALRRENTYLKARCAQLEGDIVDLQSEAGRLRERLEAQFARRAARPPNPLSGGQ